MCLFINQDIAKETREHDGLNWGLRSKQDTYFCIFLTFTPSLSVGHWVWAIQYPGELVQDLSEWKEEYLMDSSSQLKIMICLCSKVSDRGSGSTMMQFPPQ